MDILQDFKYGWDFMAKLIGADLATQRGSYDIKYEAARNQQINAENLHRQAINDAIDSLKRNIDEHPHLNLDVERFKGFVAEEYHAGTFNIDAIRQGSEHRAFTLQENGYGSVDVDTNFGKSYSLKYANTAKDVERYQSIIDPETGLSKYHTQERLIPDEQVEEARFWAHRRANKESLTRPEVASAHKETAEHLTGKISDGEGVESKTLSNEEAKEIAREAKTKGFDNEKHGIHKEELLAEFRTNYLNQALKAGLTAATITAITQIVPELYKAIDYLIKNREINLNELKKSGARIISASGESFLRGSVAYSVQTALQKGMLGEAFTSVNPSIVGVLVTVVLGTIKSSILVALGKMTPKEMGMQFVDTLVVSSGFLVSMQIAGTISQALFPQLPVVAYALGSLLGCSFAALYNIGKKHLISFCVDTGFTCFGLVEQDYTLPKEILEQIGLDIIQVSRTQIDRAEIDRTVIDRTEVDRTNYETVDIKVIRRGVIGVNRIGYIL